MAKSLYNKDSTKALEARARVLNIIDSVTPQELVTAIKDAPSLRGMILGYIAELKFKEFLSTHSEFKDLFKPDDHDRKNNKIDMGFTYRDRLVTFQLKSIQTNSIATRVLDDKLIAKVQNDGSDKRLVVLPNGHEVETTNYRVGDYDVLAVPLFPFTGKWDFAFKLNRECRTTTSKKYAVEDQQFLLSTMEDIEYPLNAPWTKDIFRVIGRLED